MNDPRRHRAATEIVAPGPDRSGEPWQRVTIDAAGLLRLMAHLTPEWHERAACRNSEAEFFQEHPGGDKISRQAKEVCGDCPVQPECLEHAIGFPEKFGTWGGTTPNERARLRRSLREFEAR